MAFTTVFFGLCLLRLEAQRAIPLCHAFRDLRSYEGRSIILTGQVNTWDRSVVLKTSECGNRFETQGFKWPTGLVIHWADAVDNDESLAFKRYLFGSTLFRRGFVLAVSIEGTLFLREQYQFGMTRYGVRGNGFGHLGTYPGQILVRKFVSVRVERELTEKDVPDLR